MYIEPFNEQQNDLDESLEGLADIVFDDQIEVGDDVIEEMDKIVDDVALDDDSESEEIMEGLFCVLSSIDS